MQEIGLRDGRNADRGDKVGNTCEQKYKIQDTEYKHKHKYKHKYKYKYKYKYKHEWK